ncbi:MAG: hypothetical protein ACRDHP_01375 [Ktedonobacterales bacterium]
MLILSSGEHQAQAHVSRGNFSENDALDNEQKRATDEMPPSGTIPEVAFEDAAHAEETESSEMWSASDVTPPAEQRPDAQRDTFPRQGYGTSERTQPYAPGMRPHTHPPLPRRSPSEHSGAQERSAASFVVEPAAGDARHASATERERDEPRDPPMPQRRSSRAEHDDRGDHEPLRPEVRGEVGSLIDALHGIFEQDRSVASQGGTTRCGICYLHFALADLEYREVEGYYVCHACAHALGSNRLPMVRRQQRA